MNAAQIFMRRMRGLITGRRTHPIRLLADAEELADDGERRNCAILIFKMMVRNSFRHELSSVVMLLLVQAHHGLDLDCTSQFQHCGAPRTLRGSIPTGEIATASPPENPNLVKRHRYMRNKRGSNCQEVTPSSLKCRTKCAGSNA
jgi:hypothetical protein